MRWAARGAGWLLRRVPSGKQTNLSRIRPAITQCPTQSGYVDKLASAARFVPSKFGPVFGLCSQFLPQQQLSYPFSRTLITTPFLPSENASSLTAIPVRSPLIPSTIPDKDKGKSESPAVGRARLIRIKQSPKKVNLVATMVRGMRVEDAMNQMAVSTKRAAKTVATLIQAAAANGVNNHGLNKSKLIVAEAFVGKDKYLRRLFPHARGKSGTRHRARCILTILVKEMSDRQEKEFESARTAHWSQKRVPRLRPHTLREVGIKRPPIVPLLEGEVVDREMTL